MTLRFDGRAVVITGAGTGLGRHYALLLAVRGAGVVIADYGVSLQGEGTSSEPAESVAAEITSTGGAAVACYASVSDPAGARSMVQAALDNFGRLDAVVNNAGIVDHAWMYELDELQVRRLLDNHAIGTFLVTKAEEARSAVDASSASAMAAGSGTDADSGSAWPGLVPQVT